MQTVKRIFDFTASLIALILLSPLIAIIAVMIRIKLGKPVLFRQLRPGYHQEPFIIYKFRTMLDLRDASGKLLSDEHRLSKWGAFLRSTSLDELPELWNVVRGDMSLVGPRPLLMQYIPRYSPEQRRRHDVRPGITGWAQIHGRNAVAWDERFKLDVWYVDHCNFLLDLKILMITIKKLFQREGISAEGHPTMPEFMGTPSAREGNQWSGTPKG